MSDSQYKALFKICSSLQKELNTAHEKIEKLEGYMEMEDRITASDVLFKIDDLYKSLGVIEIHKKPYKCPVCEGSGKNYSSEAIKHGVDAIGFYGTRADCDACEGKGVIWG